MNTIWHTLLRRIRYVPMVSMVGYVVKIPPPNQFGKRDFCDYSLENGFVKQRSSLFLRSNKQRKEYEC